MPGWLCDLLINFGGVFLGAILGALGGYWATVRHERNDTAARRAALLRALRHQLSRYSDSIPRFVQGLSNHLDPIKVAAIDHIITSDVLDARTDGLLIEKLSDLASRVEQLNEIGRVYNLHFFRFEIHQGDINQVNSRHSGHSVYSTIYSESFATLKNEVLALLPKESE